ncbi:hypothetical protein JXM83_06295 [Candidatus Woesearchaeota archaeon]|nr:hypothetical protein [Candidatus Woesearchaeota archaeon]
MNGLKCEYKDIEYFKRKLFASNQVDLEYVPQKQDDGFAFPLVENYSLDSLNFEFNYSIVDCEFEKKNKIVDIKDILLQHFNESEVSEIKLAFDVVGSIAIIEVDEKFNDRAIHIAQAILDTNKNVKTVLKKSGIHSGTFRTQNMDFVLGENTKESVYLENGVRMKLNVEDVYFSPRLSTERKRIAELVKLNEDVMELFSGCAPYSLVISKSTSAKSVMGIELNPQGHLYGVENISLNKIKNMKLYCGDVRNLVPKLNNLSVGLKCGLSNLNIVLEKNPEVQLIELQLSSDELENKLSDVFLACDNLESLGKLVMFHHVPFFKNKSIGVGTTADDFKATEEEIKIFLDLCKRRNVVGFGLHIADDFKQGNDLSNQSRSVLPEKECSLLLKNVVKNLSYLFKKYKKDNIEQYLYVENSIRALRTLDDFLEIQKKTGLKNMLLDIVHLFNACIYSKYFCPTKKQDYEYFEHLIEGFKKYFNVYFHIADTTGNHPDDRDACEIGKGIIDLSKVINFIDFGVIEVWDYFSKEYTENQNSYEVFCKLRDQKLGPKKFNRVLMPLPKTAEDFLDDALKISKKGTVVHFYDFLNEKLGEIPDVAVLKIKLACERNKVKFKVLDWVKCGDHAPHTYRVCVDFEVL